MKFQILADEPEVCSRLAENLRAALKELQLNFPVETDVIPGMAATLNAESPVLAEDHRVIASGKLLDKAEIMELLCRLHGPDFSELRRAAERSRQKARWVKKLLLLIAVSFAVWGIFNEIRQRKAEAEAEAANPVVLRFSRPIKMLYFYHRPRTDGDVKFEVLLRRTAYEAFPEEIKRKYFSIESLDAGSAAGAENVRKYKIKSFPAAILVKDGLFLPLTAAVQENPREKLIQAADRLNDGSIPARKE